MKKGENEISVSTLRDELPDLLSRVALLKQSFTIMKHGKPYAVIRPVREDDGQQSESISGDAGAASGVSQSEK